LITACKVSTDYGPDTNIDSPLNKIYRWTMQQYV